MVDKIILEKLQQSYTNCQRGHGPQRQSQRLMPVKDKRTELQGPLSLSPASLTVCHNESNLSAGSPRTAVEPWIHPGWVRAPQDHSHPPGSDPVLMDDSSGMGEGWAAPHLPLSLWCVHLRGKKHTLTHTKVYIHTYSWAVTLSMTTHLNGHVSHERFPMGEGGRKKGVMMKYTGCPLIDWGQGP